jgi:serine phosphatase RsbU (regulator of sigma subunit)
MCGSGRVTRLAVADISGHGPNMDHLAKWLRGLMRKHINLLDQTRFARAINEEFTRAGVDYFATVLLVTYFAPTDHLIICNAGHPRPIWYSSRTQAWQLLDSELPDPGSSIRQAPGTYLLKPVANLPLGVIEPTDYCQFAIKLDKGDIVLVYTDALIEASTSTGEALGEQGLLKLAADIGPANVQQLGDHLLYRVAEWTGHAPQEDDQTIVVLHHNASNPPPMTLGQALRSLAKMVGLRQI